jgi:hypothetical protein
MTDVDIIIVKELSNNFTIPIPRNVLGQYPNLDWGKNGIGNRWCKKKFNYAMIYAGKKKYKVYSDNIDDTIPENTLSDFMVQYKKQRGCIGIYVFSIKNPAHIEKRPISKRIRLHIAGKNCVSCGSRSDIIPDHKNDLYNDDRVLSSLTQTEQDFQPLCNHCNLQKRQVSNIEKQVCKIYSAKNLQKYQIYDFAFPWEKKLFDINDKSCKEDTYWYDPTEFERKIYYYVRFRMPINQLVKTHIKLIS